MKLSRRAYGPESTPDEVTAIRQQIQPFAGDVIFYRELPVQSLFHLDLFEERLREMTRRMPMFALLIDLTEAEFPSAEIRTRLKKMFLALPNLRAVAVFTGRNFLINTAAKYVLSGPGMKPFSVHRTQEEAIAALSRLAKAG
jgi:hypothetical protein